MANTITNGDAQLLRNYTMYYVPNIYYAIFMIFFFLHILWQYYTKIGGNFFNTEGFFFGS